MCVCVARFTPYRLASIYLPSISLRVRVQGMYNPVRWGLVTSKNVGAQSLFATTAKEILPSQNQGGQIFPL